MKSSLNIYDRIENIMRAFNSGFPGIEYYVGNRYEEMNYSTNYIVLRLGGGDISAPYANALDGYLDSDGYTRSYNICCGLDVDVYADLWFEDYNRMMEVLVGFASAVKICEGKNLKTFSFTYVSEDDGSDNREGEHILVNFRLPILVPSMAFYTKNVSDLSTEFILHMDDTENPVSALINENLEIPDKFDLNITR